ncbi:type 2 periplasmic-binding domain-containing protein [Planctopirus ephydatiae]|nr:ABC transporter substrate-binding protein [Planctopirus ephydatiae]
MSGSNHRENSARLWWPLAMVGALGLFIFWSWIQQPAPTSLVVFCAHDAVYAEPILRQFTEKTGIPVVVRYDTEATKSLGLVDQLISEGATTECDLFWNNELLGMVALAEKDRLIAHQGPGWKARSPGDRDARGRWTGFAARARVWIATDEFVSQLKKEQPDRAPAELFAEYFEKQGDLSRVAIARPLYGTTLTQVSLMIQKVGLETIQKSLREAVSQRHLRVVAGNGAVKNLVAQNAAALGWTDTDDAFSAIDEGAAVSMFPLLYGNRPILIPNTVALIAHRRLKENQLRPEAIQLIEYLLSPEIELALAQSGARQIPLGTVAEEQLPEEVKPWMTLRRQAWPLATMVENGELTKARQQAVNWLRQEDVVR